MNRDQIESVIRAALKFLAPVLVMKGVGTGEEWEAIAGGLIAAVTLIWGVYVKRSKEASTSPAPGAPTESN